MTRPYEIFVRPPLPGAATALVFPWPSGYGERDWAACRDALASTVLVRFDDGALLLGSIPTYASVELGPPDWRALRPASASTVGNLLEAQTWRFSAHCERRLVQLWLKERAGCFTAKSGSVRSVLRSFELRLWQHLLQEIRLHVGVCPRLNTLLAGQRQWPQAVIPYLAPVVDVEPKLRTRVQVLELAQMLGIELPLRDEGIRFDTSAAWFARLERPNAHVESIALALGCSTSAVRHVLRGREHWRPELSNLSPQTRHAVIRGLDAMRSRSHWPREREHLKYHVETTQRVLRIAELAGEPGWQDWAYAEGASADLAMRRLDHVAQVLTETRADLYQAQGLGLLGPVPGTEVAQTMHSVVQLARRHGPRPFPSICDEVYRLASAAFLEAIADRFASQQQGSPWDLIEACHEPFRAWVAEPAWTGVRLRLLAHRAAFQDWGRVAENCVGSPGVVIAAYTARQRLVFAVEQADEPHDPIATVALGTTKEDCQNALPHELCHSVVELQLVPKWRSVSKQSRMNHSEAVMEACRELEQAGHAIWRSDFPQARRWRQLTAELDRAYGLVSTTQSVGAHLPEAFDAFLRRRMSPNMPNSPLRATGLRPPVPALKPRILLIEDDVGRIEVFTRWLKDTEFVLSVVRSGGQALGMLGQGSTQAIAGILLDHDLSDSPFTETDRGLSTSDVIPLIKLKVRRSVPILIHSHNANKPPLMQRSLQSEGFSVCRVRFEALTPARFHEWLDEVRDQWEPEDGSSPARAGRTHHHASLSDR